MPIYHQLGQVPHKRHVAFRREGGGLYYEELMGNKGFTGPASLLYHLQHPTQIREVRPLKALRWEEEAPRQFKHRHFLTAGLPATPSITADRLPLLYNADVAIDVVQPQREDDYFYRNAQGDELVYVTEGEGVLESVMGDIPFGQGDYLVIPRSVLHRFRFTKTPVRCLVIESSGYIRTPKRYRNEHGQLMENAPYSERDIRRPRALEVHDERGEFRLVVKKDHHLTEFVLDHHPFDVVGWDGYYYPWAFNIGDFEPRVGRVHLPPPTHQTFEGDNFVVCSFCPRPYDFDADAVPVPYNHSNVMSDEVLYYASAEFMSRKGIEYGSVTLHPDGVPHGPHPGRVEQSLGQSRTDELAVMLDTFHPLRVSRQALGIEDKSYYRSWVEPD
ncbi:MAG: homogentisate 1,2-dioxygenase [Luteitalea sp.]|nr:homogentisate 1,2-dioxygenase [Luteitalea sp.]